MFASTATASAQMSPTDHSSARRLNNSKLICEISASSASLRCVTSTCASHDRLHRRRHVDRAAAPIRVHRQIRVRAVQLAAPAATPLARAPPPLVQQHAAQRPLRIRQPARQPPPARKQLAHTQLAELRSSHQPVRDSLTGSPILPPAANRGDHRRHLDQHLERQRPLGRHRAAIGRRLIQRRRSARRRHRTHTRDRSAATTHIQNLEPLARQRMKRMRDHQRTQKLVGRPRSMT